MNGKGKIAKGVVPLFALVVIGTGLGGMTQTALNTMVADVLGDLSTDIGWGQWLTTVYIFCMGAAVPLASFVQRKLSVRTLMLASFSLYLVGSLCDFTAVNFPMLIIGRVMEAVSTGILMPLLQTIAMTRFPDSMHGTAMGFAGIALGFAPNIGPVIGGAIASSVGWRFLFLILSAASVILLIGTVAVVRDKDAKDPAAVLDVPSLCLSMFGFGGVLLSFTAAANMSLGAVTIAFVPVSAPLWVFAACQAVRCMGLTTLIPSTTAAALGPLGKAGITTDGSATLIMCRQVSAALATAVMVFLLKLFTAPETPVLGYSMALGFSGLLALLYLLRVILFVHDGKGEASAE